MTNVSLVIKGLDEEAFAATVKGAHQPTDCDRDSGIFYRPPLCAISISPIASSSLSLPRHPAISAPDLGDISFRSFQIVGGMTVPEPSCAALAGSIKANGKWIGPSPGGRKVHRETER